MQPIKTADFEEAMKEFYGVVMGVRSACASCAGGEPRDIRNATIARLVNDSREYIKKPEPCLDALSGDCIVPLAVLYLQKEGVLPEAVIDGLFALDNNSRGGLDLMLKHAAALGIASGVVPVQADLYFDESWKQKLPSEGIGLVTAINPDDEGGDLAVARDGISKEVSGFSGYLLFGSIARVSERLFVAQPAGPGGIHGSFTEDIKGSYRIVRGSTDAAGSNSLYTAFCTRKEK